MSAGLLSLFDPRSVAVVGASDNVEKWGHWIARGALNGSRRRSVHLVNRHGGSVLGVPCRPSLDALDETPELVCVVAPPSAVRTVVEQGLEVGVRNFVVITAEVETPGLSPAAAERELAELVRSRGARLLGPNCMGVVDTATELCLSWGEFPSGNVGMVSQSGNLGLEVGRLLRRVGQGFSRFVSLGNQRDIDAAEAIEALIDHEPTHVIAVYAEDLRDGRRFARVLAAARKAGKPVLLLTVGRSPASGHAAASHTGALVSNSAVVDAVCRDVGALRLDSAGELVDTALMLLSPAVPAGRCVAVVGDSGGQGALAADSVTAVGLDVPELSEATKDFLRGTLARAAGVRNPVDLAGAGEADLNAYLSVSEALLGSGETDSVLLTGYFGDYSTGTPALEERECAVAEALAAAARCAGRLLAVHTMAGETRAVQALRAGGVPVYERVEQAARAIAAAARWSASRTGAPAISSAASAGDTEAADRPRGDGGETRGDYHSVRALLAGHGVDFPDAVFVRSAEEAVEESERMGYPVVLKAMGLAHKTEAGGVVLSLADAEQVRAAFARMHAAVGAHNYAVERMVRTPHAVELIVGVRQDPTFGPVVMVGLGGTSTELHADTALALAPVTEEHARVLLDTLRFAPLLHGWRGAPAVDLVGAARTIAAISRAGAEHPELIELEVNPLVAHPRGVCALDAHGVPAC